MIRTEKSWSLALALLACLAGCAQNGAGAAAPSDRAAVASDDATMAVLNAARALHHEADLLEASGDFAAASRAVERVLALRVPASVEEAPDIRLDAHGRIGELALAAGDPERALARCDDALREARRETVLVGRLHLVRGRALRALSERATAAGDTATATTRRTEALAALELSIEINQRVLASTAADGGTGR